MVVDSDVVSIYEVIEQITITWTTDSVHVI